LVEHRSDGEIKVQIYPTGQLGTQAEMMEAVKMGTLQACTSNAFEAVCDKLLIYSLPFLFENAEAIYPIFRGPIGEKIAEGTKENGVIILATSVAGGLRNFTNNKRPITKPEDMKGVKMRTPPIDTIIKTMDALGAGTVSVPFTDLYMALKTGVADGQENPFIYIVTERFYEIQKYLTVVNYQAQPNPMFVNLNWFNSLSPENQAIVKASAEDAWIFLDALNLKMTQEYFEFLEENMEVNTLTDEQRQLFIEKSRPVYQYYVDEEFFTWDEINEIMEAAK
jgi:tripartite ATP-independent transporter DctP family solute receptor